MLCAIMKYNPTHQRCVGHPAKVMFLEKGDEGLPNIEADLPLTVIVWCLAVPTVILGIYWEPLMNLALSAARSLGL